MSEVPKFKIYDPKIFTWEPKTLIEAISQIIYPPTSLEDFDKTGQRAADEILKIIPSGSKILDFGCGVGRILKYLPNAIGYEPIPTMRKFAYEWLKDTDCIVVESLDTFYQYFDVVFEVYVFQHINDEKIWESSINMIHKALKPSGQLLCFNSGEYLGHPKNFEYLGPNNKFRVYKKAPING